MRKVLQMLLAARKRIRILQQNRIENFQLEFNFFSSFQFFPFQVFPFLSNIYFLVGGNSLRLFPLNAQHSLKI